MLFSCDFETITTEPTRVWLWGICKVNNYEDYVIGFDIESFINEIKKRKYNKSKLYFHNLKFDGTFIVDYLLNNGYKYTNDKKLLKNEFNCIISGMGMWYQIKIKFDNGYYVKIQDSLKKLPFKVSAIAKAFNLKMTKGEIDYHKYRDKTYRPDDNEIDYLLRDIGIVAQALKFLNDNGMKKMTVASDAFNTFKELNGKFRQNYPLLNDEVDTFCRKAYRGGWVYVNPKYKGMLIVQKGIVLDVNSMYPWAMRYKPLPYGEPIYYKGEYKTDKNYPLYIAHVYADFKLKDGMFPSIQIKTSPRFLGREYVTDSDGFVELWLTSVDLEIFKTCYNCFEIQYIDGYKFRATDQAFITYIDKWIKVKQENTGAMRTLAKLMLNSLYGKFAKNPDVTGKHPIIKDDRVRIVTNNNKEMSDTNYTPVACFVTAWARDNIIRSAIAVKDRFLYSDTDSMHLIGTEEPKNLNIHNSNLGAWKIENTFIKAKYLHAKCYVEEIENNDSTELKVTVAGLPQNCHNQVNWNNFKVGAIYTGKLLQKSVKGGAILVETEFQIKDN